MFFFQKKLTKKQRLEVKRADALLRKRCPKGLYKALYGKDSLRSLYPIVSREHERLAEAALSFLPSLLSLSSRSL